MQVIADLDIKVLYTHHLKNWLKHWSNSYMDGNGLNSSFLMNAMLASEEYS